MEATSDEIRNAKAFGWMLVVGAVLSTGFAMVHPHVSSHELDSVLAEMVAGATFNGFVHGSLLALMIVLVAGFLGLSMRLGIGWPTVTLAMASYLLGALAMAGAAVINGFALGIFAGRYDGAVRPDQVAAVSASFNMAGSIAATWAGIGAVGMSAAIALWSVRLVALGGAQRILGALGLVIGIAAAGMLISGTLVLNVHGFLLLVMAQSLWTVAVGVQMARGRI
ncbi:MAG TPA: hypothetical protein VIT38_13240 [Allosphingosinicella sp.]|jgi:hypothetical protein